jgi:predicted RNA-binding Zn-ribbon protein involved in translation (DUF1610 family)
MEARACPICGHDMRYDSAAALFRCPACGHRVEKPYEPLDKAKARLAASAARPAVRISHRGEIDLRARSLFELAHDTLWRGDRDEAARLFRRVLDIQPDFVDAHLALAKLTGDSAQQRHHLGEILARDPGHLEALRMIMALNGRLSESELEITRTDRTPAPPRPPANPVETRTQLMLCPVCGGALTTDENSGRVFCRFCGHEEKLLDRRVLEERGDALGMALLERRARPVQWKIGERMLRCEQCGSARTIPASKLSDTCPFCGSTHVLLADALDTVTAPDGLVPFRISEADAQQAIRERLGSLSERLAGMLDDNRIANARLEGVFLPFWLFDVLTQVNVSISEEPSGWEDNRGRTFRQPVMQQFTERDGLTGVQIAAFHQPEPALVRAVGPFELDGMLPYEPKLLARHAAMLYDIDFDAASLEARSMASAQARENALRQYQDGGSRRVTAMALPLQMSFELVLLPVFVATLFERDGDVRPALVNGITGQAVLGKATTPRDLPL